MRVLVSVSVGVAVRTFAFFRFARNQVDSAVTNARFRENAVRGFEHRPGFAEKNERLQTIFGAYVHVHDGVHYVEVFVLRLGRALRKASLVVVEDVTHHGRARLIVASGETVGFGLANEVAKGFGAVGVAVLGEERFEAFRGIVGKRKGDAFHRDASGNPRLQTGEE